MSAQDPTRIGIVLVHGIGEQRRFEHLSGEVSELVKTLQEMQDQKMISGLTVRPRESQDAAYLGEHLIWKAEGQAPLRIDFKQHGVSKTLCIHEVWWADLDIKNANLIAKIKFWLWALGSWGFVHENKLFLPGAQDKMVLPRFDDGRNVNLPVWDRVRLWFVGVVFFLLLLSLKPLAYLADRIGMPLPGADLVYRYLGDVKLYQDYGKPGSGVAVADIGEPPRVPIRRRIVRTLIDVYFENYDRWYVAAHSLGTVLAWNAIMETAHSLPNYLDLDLWQICKADGLGFSDPNEAGSTGKMRPARPSWLGDQDVISRAKLFSRMRGLVTYGSPLDKFACMWGFIVPINKDKSAFQQDFEWVNVYDTSDPVAAKLDAYREAEVPPVSYAYKASRILLLSHIRYLTFRGNQQDGFAKRLLAWFTTGDAFEPPAETDPSWGERAGGDLYRGVWWVGGALVLLLLDAWFGTWIHGQFPWLLSDSLWANCGWIAITAMASVTLAGLALKGSPRSFS